MPCTLSTQKSAHPAKETAATKGWSSLPDDLVAQVGNCLLPDNDIYSYMDFRAICTSWRRPTKDIAKPGRFDPSKWVLLDRHGDVLKFVNVETGRFLVKNIPLLRKYLFIGATGSGMIILKKSKSPNQVRMLNPFTGLIVRFKASLPIIGWVREATVATSPMMLFISNEAGKFMWADQDSEKFQEFGVDYRNTPLSMTPFDGKVYLSDKEGSIFSSTGAAVTAEEHSHRSAQTISMASTIRRPAVRRVDTERNKLELVTSIGNRALFLSDVRFLSVEASKFQAIQGGCIYFVDPVPTAGNREVSLMTTFHVADQVQDDIIFDVATMAGGSKQPFTIAQVFANYSRSIYYSKRGFN
ncbi:uncharacterized protein C2845_PM03G11020 [Panicum miliaceum]|uniref:KIB1-4 beta-propeller domain-containing protein n=1 Tax=Panicum miliaceum TaxID=4540 RepID=A0A3L6T773_PANMI|nr:uncharacterized protein C2845_PM03G11020 [Panicum miliaceum]